MFKVKFADIGEGLTEGTVTEVLVKIGQSVKMGDSLFHVETDKVNSEIPAPVAGKIAKILIKNNEEIKVGQVVMEIDDGKKDDSPAKEENASVVGSTPVSNDLLPSRGPQQKSIPNPTTKTQQQKPSVSPSKVKILDSAKHYDVIVIGAGVGGYVSAIKASQLGLKTLIIEKQYYGGVCLNVGCIPTKTLLKSAAVYNEIVNAVEFGVIVNSPKENVKPDWKKIQARKDDVVSKLTNGVQSLLKKYKVDKIDGEAVAVDSHTIKVDKNTYTCENLVIATGSEPNDLNLPGAKEAIESGYLINSTSGLSVTKIPKKFIVIGGGVIGIEFATLFASLGSEVTILQGLGTILEMLDSDISKEMTKHLTKEAGINIITNVKVKKFGKKEVTFEVDGKEQTLKSDYCLQSVGRHAITKGFDKIGIEKNERGYIPINDYCQTNVPNVYAIGDVTGKLMLAHVASREGIIAAVHIARQRGIHAEDMKMNFDRVPSCIYSHPEVACVGKTEDELKKNNIPYQTYKFPFSAIGKAFSDGETTGFVKLIIEPKYKSILGAHIMSKTATDMISEITTVMECEGSIYELVKVIHPHPTFSEAIGEAAEALESGTPINF